MRRCDMCNRRFLIERAIAVSDRFGEVVFAYMCAACSADENNVNDWAREQIGLTPNNSVHVDELDRCIASERNARERGL